MAVASRAAVAPYPGRASCAAAAPVAVVLVAVDDAAVEVPLLEAVVVPLDVEDVVAEEVEDGVAVIVAVSTEAELVSLVLVLVDDD